jgi:hypothetical protein
MFDVAIEETLEGKHSFFLAFVFILLLSTPFDVIFFISIEDRDLSEAPLLESTTVNSCA